ncbi:hypothetical protein DSLASN_06580 [Desulfoluna limicola]|uniref:Uncharacterized protein n=1 Tax=Desulfoluna limicola TaxID=2810562 RepID=A0ABN6F0D7_9BACT|nr:hypothetical protein DSLASN_06580 [Desulfoluna limicola]
MAAAAEQGSAYQGKGTVYFGRNYTSPGSRLNRYPKTPGAEPQVRECSEPSFLGYITFPDGLHPWNFQRQFYMPSSPAGGKVEASCGALS